MKKLSFFAIIALGALMVSCKPAQTEEKEAAPAEKSQAIAAMRVAYDLAKYGYEVESASALVEAANILAGVPTEALEAEAQQGEEVENETAKGEAADLTICAILATAKELAGNDKVILESIARVEAKLAAVAEGTRGAVGGAKYGSGRVYSHSTTYYDVQFYGNSFAECAVVGDGDTDLDLYVYDENGNLICSDSDYTDQCYVSWVPAWTGYFRIKVVNRGGVYNNFVIATN